MSTDAELKQMIAEYRMLSTSNVSDGLDRLGIKGAPHGIGPLWDACPKIVGPAATLMTPAPKMIEQSATVDDALEMMRAHRITVLFVVPDAGSRRPVGAVQIYDIASTPPWGR